MKLPNVEHASIARDKIVHYLLSSEHRDGQNKARFFNGFGFTKQNWQIMVEALLSHARQNEVKRREPSPFGERYIIEGPLQCPNGRSPNVRTVWFVRLNEEWPRFVTAYPIPEGREK